MPNQKHDSKCQTETNNGSERQTENVALNAKLKRHGGSKRQKVGDECPIVIG